MRIDAHHHLWRYRADEYAWMDDRMQVLRRDFVPEDLEAELARSRLDGAVAVQARQSVEETHWLLELAHRYTFIKGVVGWVSLVSNEVDKELELVFDEKLKGVRHIVQDEADDDFILRDDFNRGISRLKHYGLVYDILIFHHHLPQTIQFVDRHPGQRFVLDHIAKPPIREGVLDPWREELQRLAKRENVFCKLSGMVTEADWTNWREEALKPYFEVVLEAFGPKRLMFGSDWPVCLLAGDYQSWFKAACSLIAPLSPDEQLQILGKTASQVYTLSQKPQRGGRV